MSTVFSGRIRSFDWTSISIYVALVSIGWLMIFASSGDPANPSFLTFSALHGKQLLFIIVSFVIIIVCTLLPIHFWRNVAFIAYFLSIILLLLVLFLGKDVNGARSWFNIAGFSLQPAEFAKFGTLLAVSSFVSSTSFRIAQRRDLMTLLALFLIPPVLIMLQPDAGSALVFSAFFILLYRLGLSPIYYLVFLGLLLCFILSVVLPIKLIITCLAFLAVIFLSTFLKKPLINYALIGIFGLFTISIICYYYNSTTILVLINCLSLAAITFLLITKKLFNQAILVNSTFFVAILLTFIMSFAFHNVLEKHQQDRINVWLKPSQSDPRGALYNVIQSKVAIGSGGLTGKGFMEGKMTKFNFVPEQSTDFIFCTVGEEQGFLGVISLIILYMALLMRIISVSEATRLNFVKYYGYGFAAILLFHSFINIGMTMGLVPIIGIPLPMLSYGGSSLIFFSLMFGVYLRLSMQER